MSSDAALARLAAWAEAQVPRLADAACATIVERIALYRKGDLVPPEDLRRSVESNMRFFAAAIGHPGRPKDFTAPQETGRRRAHQRMPLPEVLQAYRISFATLWDALVDHAHRSRAASAVGVLLTASSMTWQLMDEHALALTEAYRAATAEQMLAQQRRRTALVEALLTGHPGLEANPWEAAALLGLPQDAQLVVVAADTRGLAEESLPGVESRLAARGVVSGWRLTPAQQLGLVALEDDDQLDTLLAELRAIATARTGLSPRFRALVDTPRALHLAQSALAGVPPSAVEVRVFGSSPLAALMVCEPAEGQRLADQVMGAVLGLRVDDRDKLLETLNAYLDNAGSVSSTARALFCHENTVRYRLRNLEELTERSLSDPLHVAELATAAFALRLSSATARWRGDQPRVDTRGPRPARASSGAGANGRNQAARPPAASRRRPD